MKFYRVFSATALLLSVVSAQAQFKRGDKMVGASIASILYNSGKAEVSFPQSRGYTNHTNSFSLRIEPSFGWFISEKTAIGATVNINPSSQKNRYEDLGTTFQEDKTSSFNIGAGGFLRNYFGSNTSSFMPFGQFGFNVGINSSNNEGFKFYDASPDFKVSYDGESSGGLYANAALQFGLTRMMGENAGLDIYVGYNYSYNKNTFKTTTIIDNAPYDGTPESVSENEPTTKFTNHGVVVGVGFQVFLRGGRK